MGDDMDHGPVLLCLHELLHQPEEVLRGVPGGGQEPEVEVVAEV